MSVSRAGSRLGPTRARCVDQLLPQYVRSLAATETLFATALSDATGNDCSCHLPVEGLGAATVPCCSAGAAREVAEHIKYAGKIT